MTTPPKTWFFRLFCSHKWQPIEDLALYKDPTHQTAKLPYYFWRRWECEKCGKIKKQRRI